MIKICRLLAQISNPAHAAWKAAALQDPPPKCLILILDATRPADATRLPEALEAAGPVHMHAVAREGCSGFLALRQRTDGACRESAVLAQLLGVHKASACPPCLTCGHALEGALREWRALLCQEVADDTHATWPSIGERCAAVWCCPTDNMYVQTALLKLRFRTLVHGRYKGMAAGMLSNAGEALRLAQRAGLACCSTLEGTDIAGLPTPAHAAELIAKHLGEQSLAGMLARHLHPIRVARLDGASVCDARDCTAACTAICAS